MKSGSERNFAGLLADRWQKERLYASAEYWNMKAVSYSGLARSNWPSNAYNDEVHRLQMRAVDTTLGEVRGLHVLDVGCGTGRTSVHLARRGAKVTGWDFAERALSAAATEAGRHGLQIAFERRNVLDPPSRKRQGRFDVVLSVGCLALACRDANMFDRALQNLVAMTRCGGRLLLLEPIHRSRFLRRMLALSEEKWCAQAERAGLIKLGSRRLCFVPSRLLLAFFDLPPLLVKPLFRAGESLLSRLPAGARLADYTLLDFERPG
jgi:2-polyprenyl-3-methyl-5-hydroxy-6-metoxy-1,4-benzoquinol methylase